MAGEVLVHRLVELPGTFQVRVERLLHHDARVLGPAGARDSLGDPPEQGWRHFQVEQDAAALGYPDHGHVEHAAFHRPTRAGRSLAWPGRPSRRRSPAHPLCPSPCPLLQVPCACSHLTLLAPRRDRRADKQPKPALTWHLGRSGVDLTSGVMVLPSRGPSRCCSANHRRAAETTAAPPTTRPVSPIRLPAPIRAALTTSGVASSWNPPGEELWPCLIGSFLHAGLLCRL
jgi:hypothetical protein